MTRPRRDTGATLFELAAVLAILSVGLAASMSVLDRGDRLARDGAARLRTDAGGRRALDALVDLVQESSIRFMDTATRVHNGPGGSDFLADRFQMPTPGFSQCLSPTCRFHTSAGVVTAQARMRCAFDYRTGGGAVPLARGKIWPDIVPACPLDGSPVAQTAAMDVLKFYSARRPDGVFETAAGSGPEPDWRNLVIVAPFVQGPGRSELRQYVVTIDDLLAGTVTSSGDSPFDATPPDMVALFDFGTDGTTNGIPDGSVPLDPTVSDADTDVLFIGTVEGETAVIATKTLGSSTSYPWRTLSLVVRLRDGMTTLTVDHHETATVFWTAQRIVTRPPRVLARGVTEFAVATAVSDPFNAATNPDGISDVRIVRVTVATTDMTIRKGAKEWTHDVETLTLKPRN